MSAAKCVSLCDSEDFAAWEVIRCLECVSPNVLTAFGSSNTENKSKAKVLFLIITTE